MTPPRDDRPAASGEVWTHGTDWLVGPDGDEVDDELAEALLAYAEAHPGPLRFEPTRAT